MILTSLHSYPVKSCKGMDLQEMEIGALGPLWDRRWMLVNRDGRFLSQRLVPKMALISSKVEHGILKIIFPDGTTFLRPITEEGKWIEVEVWKDRCQALDQGDEAAAVFSDFLGLECRLVYFSAHSLRIVDQKYAVSPQDGVSFSDGFPFLIVSEESLADLNGRLDVPVGMNRFRPNLVVKGCLPFAEDGWRLIRIGSLQFRIVKPCSRCVITCIDPETSVKGVEPMQTLSSYRKMEKGIFFGQNAIQLGAGVLRVGDRVDVLE